MTKASPSRPDVVGFVKQTLLKNRYLKRNHNESFIVFSKVISSHHAERLLTLEKHELPCHGSNIPGLALQNP